MANWKYIVGSVFGGALLLTAGILLGHFAIPKEAPPLNCTMEEVNCTNNATQDLEDLGILEDFMNQVEATNIRENLRKLAAKPHMATTKGDQDLVKLLLERWNDPEFGLDKATEMKYDVFLSFPDPEKPNRVTVENDTAVLFESRETEENLTSDQGDPEVVKPYAAYGPAGTAKGKLVYANQGNPSDYEFLVNQSINLNGTIAITRYGGAGRVAKAINGAKFGVIGVVVYTDPGDINDGKSSPEETYPHSWYMPRSGVERGSFKSGFGDLLTPYFPAKNFTYRIPEDEITGLSTIPVQPIGFEDAKELICNLDGPKAGSSWQGALGCDYHLGPGFRENGRFSNTSNVHVKVYNKRQIKPSSNVVGVIRGSVEPDRYVLYGNHRDSWVHGAIDPSSGTAVMLEITRILGKMVKEGKWRPRRTLIFGSWGAEEFGLIGSTEYTEEFFSKLQERSVAYINVDIAVFANATLRVQGTPPAQKVVFAATQQVKTPDNASVSVYENWKHHSSRNSSIYGIIPSLGSLGAGSDFAPFIHYLGITAMDIAYTYDRSKTSARIYPAYHTAFDTFDYADRYIDPGFTSHRAVAQTAGNVLLRLAESLILPFNVSDYGETLQAMCDTAEQKFQKDLLNHNISLGCLVCYASEFDQSEVGSHTVLLLSDYGETLQAMCDTAEQKFQKDLLNHNISLDPLRDAVLRFHSAAADLNQRIASLQNEKSPSPLALRTVNDQLMLLERTFLDPRAFPDKHYYSHVIWASRSSSVRTFPGLADAVAAATKPDKWDDVHKHLTVVIQAVENAASFLEPVA